MLNLNFYYSSPIDFEHKNYLILDFLSKIDESFSIHKLSPYLLYTEKLVSELNNFKINLELFNKNIRKNILSFDFKKGIFYEEIKNDEISEILEIVDYSKPLLEAKIKLGYKLFVKYPQILF
jgi:hypothetical protein